jgi:hypothetical protein
VQSEERERNAKGIVAPEEVQVAVRRLIADGEAVALSQLRMSSQTVARIGAGLHVNRSSVELARVRLGLDEDDRG